MPIEDKALFFHEEKKTDYLIEEKIKKVMNLTFSGKFDMNNLAKGCNPYLLREEQPYLILTKIPPSTNKTIDKLMKEKHFDEVRRRFVKGRTKLDAILEKYRISLRYLNCINFKFNESIKIGIVNDSNFPHRILRLMGFAGVIGEYKKDYLDLTELIIDEVANGNYNGFRNFM